MGLPEWCQTHTFEDFLNLMKEDTMNDITNTEVTADQTVSTEVSAELNKAITEEIAEGTPVVAIEDKEYFDRIG